MYNIKCRIIGLVDVVHFHIGNLPLLTAMVQTALWRAAKKNGSARSRITDALKEEKRSRFDQSTVEFLLCYKTVSADNSF